MGSLSDGAPRWGRVSQPGHLHVAEVGDAHGGQAAAGHQDEAAAADAVGSEALLRGSGAGSGSAAGSAPPHPSPLTPGRAPRTEESRGSTPTRPPPRCPSAGRAGPRAPCRPPGAAGPRSPGNRRFLRPPRAIAAPAPLGCFRRGASAPLGRAHGGRAARSPPGTAVRTPGRPQRRLRYGAGAAGGG